MQKPIPLVLFTKAPVAGKVKTRLQPQCSAEEAAEVAQILMQETIKVALKAWSGKVVLAVWPDAEHPFLQRMLEQYTLEYFVQAEGDLGLKMQQALDTVGFPAAVMGCDVPHCPESVYKEALHNLQQGHNVIGPAWDGGYYLLGLQNRQATLFENISWGEDQVYAVTQEKAKSCGIAFQDLPHLDDIDHWQDLQKVAPKVPALQQYLARKKS